MDVDDDARVVRDAKELERDRESTVAALLAIAMAKNEVLAVAASDAPESATPSAPWVVTVPAAPVDAGASAADRLPVTTVTTVPAADAPAAPSVTAREPDTRTVPVLEAVAGPRLELSAP